MDDAERLALVALRVGELERAQTRLMMNVMSSTGTRRRAEMPLDERAHRDPSISSMAM